MFSPIENHAERSVARLISQYKRKNTVEGLVTALVTPVQSLEDGIVSLNTQRSVNDGEGIQLDRLGAVVGLARVAGQSDDDYRQTIKAQIKINSSEGEAVAITSAVQLLTGASQVLLFELFPAAITIQIPASIASIEEGVKLNELIDTVAAGGVRMEGIATYDGANAFSFAGDLPGAGFGSSADPSAGGKFASFFPIGGEFGFAGDDPFLEGFGSLGDPLVGGRFRS